MLAEWNPTGPGILVVAAIIGLVPAAIAEKKGHSFALWWLFGAALFIVALPAALLLEKSEAVATGAGARKCPHCAEFIRPEAAVCRYCGRESEAWTLHNGKWWVYRGDTAYYLDRGQWIPVAREQP